MDSSIPPLPFTVRYPKNCIQQHCGLDLVSTSNRADFKWLFTMDNKPLFLSYKTYYSIAQAFQLSAKQTMFMFFSLSKLTDEELSMTALLTVIFK